MNTGFHVFEQAIMFLHNIEPIFDSEISLLKQISGSPTAEINKTKIESVVSSVWKKIDKKWQPKNSTYRPQSGSMNVIVAASGYKWWDHEISDGSVAAWVFDITKNGIDVIWSLPMPDNSTVGGIGSYSWSVLIGKESAVHEPSDAKRWIVGEKIPVIEGDILSESIRRFVSEKDKE